MPDASQFMGREANLHKALCDLLQEHHDVSIIFSLHGVNYLNFSLPFMLRHTCWELTANVLDLDHIASTTPCDVVLLRIVNYTVDVQTALAMCE